MSKRVKILFTNHVGSFDAGGAEKVLVNILRHLELETFKIYLAIPSSEAGAISAALPRSIQRIEHYVPIFNHPGSLLFRLLLTVLLYPVEVGRLLRVVWREEVDVLYANSLLSGFYLTFVAKLARKPLIYHEHSLVEQRTRRSFMWLFRWVTAKASTVVAISESVANSIERHGVSREKIRVVYNGIENQAISQDEVRAMADRGYSRLQLGKQRPPIVGMVANFHPWKGHNLLLETVPIVKAKFPNVLYVLVGRPIEEEYYASLRQYVDDHELGDRVRFTGFQDRVGELIAAMDVLVVASNPEPFGMVVLEGMQLYKPIIATKRGGPAEILENCDSGLLVEPDPSEMASAINKLLTAPELRRTIGKTGNDVLRRRFRVEEQAQNIARVVLEVSDRS